MKDGIVELLIGGSVGATIIATSWWVVKGDPGPAGGTAVMLALWAIMAILLRKPTPSDEANEEIARLKEKNANFESAVEMVVLTALVRELDRFESQLVELRKQADKVQP